MNRRTFLSATLGAGTVAALGGVSSRAAVSARAAAGRPSIEPFSVGEVTLGPGR